jgi:DNA-binding transcriptional regulator YdaS (Cro superfamily)
MLYGMSKQTALDRAIEEAGGVMALAAVLGVKHPNVAQWRKSGRIPARQAIAIEQWTLGRIRAVDCLNLAANDSRG